MGNNTELTKTPLEQMPPAMLAELFSSGIVVIPAEFKDVKISKEPVKATKKAPEKLTATPPANTQPEKIKPSVNPVAQENIMLPPGSEPKELTWLGNFGKKVLVVVQDTSALYVNDAELALLTKILGAVGLSIADTAIVNAAVHNLEYNALNQKLPAEVAFYFGIAPADIGAPIRFPQFQVQRWNNTTFLHAPTLGSLNENSNEALTLKKDLWAALKKIFN